MTRSTASTRSACTPVASGEAAITVDAYELCPVTITPRSGRTTADIAEEAASRGPIHMPVAAYFGFH
jgi:hypothetical protein